MTKRSKKLFTVTDLGPGDGGKGGVVHKIVHQLGAHTVVKVGGAQGSHGVRTSRGERFAFSQFGCGTFDGARTHISRNFVADPIGLLREGRILQHAWKIDDAFDMITVDEDTLCITPYHGIASRLREIARKDNPRGTIGVGVGEAYRDSLSEPDLAIRAGDLRNIDHCRWILHAVREQKTSELQKLLEKGWLPEDQEIVDEQFRLLQSQELVDFTIEHFKEMHEKVKIVDRDHLAREILAKDGVVVVESSHGVLTDNHHGFHPHTSKLRTLPQCSTFGLLQECGYDGHVIKLGVTRAYQIRHGAGPMVTESPEMIGSLLPGSNKDENRYQGTVRVGPLDFVALRYAIAACGGADVLDGLAISWLDQIQICGHWSICDRYIGADDPDYFTPDGNIRVFHSTDTTIQYAHQERLGQLLSRCRPIVIDHDVSTMSTAELISFGTAMFREKLGIPVRMMSIGPTEDDKVCL